MKYIFLAILVTVFISTKGQEKYEQEIETISTDLYKQLISTSIKEKIGKDSLSYKVALIDILNEDGNKTQLTELLEQELVVSLASSSPKSFSLIDRKNIINLLDEKELTVNSEDKKNFAKILGKINAANIMITGKLINFDDSYKIIFSIYETKNGTTIGGIKGKLSSNSTLKSKNSNIVSNNTSKPSTSSSNTNLNENSNKKSDNLKEFNSAQQIDPKCATKKTGVITIENNSGFRLLYTFTKPNSEDGFLGKQYEASVNAHEILTLPGIEEGDYNYIALTYENNLFNGHSEGRVTVIKCQKSKITTK